MKRATQMLAVGVALIVKAAAMEVAQVAPIRLTEISVTAFTDVALAP